MKRIILTLCLGILSSALFAQSKADIDINQYSQGNVRVVIVNDLGGDPDGLFQLAQHLLSPSSDIRGIVCSTLPGRAGFGGGSDEPMPQPGQGAGPGVPGGNRPEGAPSGGPGAQGPSGPGAPGSGGPQGAPRQASSVTQRGIDNVNQMLELMGVSGQYRVVAGSDKTMTSSTEPQDSEGARLIIEEALRTDTQAPLFVVCGGGMTDVASAYLLNPEIEGKFTLVWIGGQEYEDLAIPPPGYSVPEYNLNIDIPAVQAVFNDSKIPIWQVPRDVYRQCNYSLAELVTEVEPQGALGAYLAGQITRIMGGMSRFGMPAGESYVLGDSPLVLLTSLRCVFESDPSSCRYVVKQAPEIADDGTYRYRHDGRPIRVYTQVDTRLMFGDMVAKLKLLAKTQQ